MIPPKPLSRPEKVSVLRHMKLFCAHILSVQPAKLYRAWMVEFKTPFFHSFIVNDPRLIKTVLNERPDDFPKSDRIGAGLRPLLGDSVFLTNGDRWKRQRRIIDPAFEGGRLCDTYPAIHAAGVASVARLTTLADGTPQEVEVETSHVAADIIVRTLFSIPIDDQVATEVLDAFRSYQRTQPILNLAAFIPGPKRMPRSFRSETKTTARKIRGLITGLTQARLDAIEAGEATGDMATKIMTTQDPQTGETFSVDEMVDQVAIFFLAGHETSASAIAWALYLLALYPEWQDQLADEAAALSDDFATVSKLRLTRDMFREALRLYPPVPMMVREATCLEHFRDRDVTKGAQVVLSPWHLHRHTRLWDNPDGFDPTRWATENGKTCAGDAYMPFSSGPRICTGAGFAMIEGVTLLTMLVRHFKFEWCLTKHRSLLPI